MTTDAHTENGISVSIKHFDAVHEGLALVINNLHLSDKVKEEVLAGLKEAQERGANGATDYEDPKTGKKMKVSLVDIDRISKVGMEAFMAEGNLPVEMAFAADPQAVCDALYGICSLAKVDTTPANLHKLDKTLKELFEGAPPPHVIKTMEGEIRSLKRANERLQGLVKGNDPVTLMEEGEKFETLRDEVVHGMAKSNADLKAEAAFRGEKVLQLQRQVKDLKANLYDLQDGMEKIQGSQRLDIIASLKEVLGIVEGTGGD